MVEKKKGNEDFVAARPGGAGDIATQRFRVGPEIDEYSVALKLRSEERR